MSKVSETILKDFGKAVKRARALKTWTLDELGAQFSPAVGKSFISKVESGTKDALNPRTVGRFIKALELDESWIDTFLDDDPAGDSEETDAERDADRIYDRLQREGATAGGSVELLIRLANTYAEGKHRDLESAYVAVKKALETFERMKAAGDVPDNADGQYQSLMAEVARLNQSGDMNGAAQALDDAMARVEQSREKLFQDQLGQDRLRNRPDLAAKRLIQELRREPRSGGLFWAVNNLSDDWMQAGDRAGDMFGLHVALELAKANYVRGKGRRGLEAAALHSLGWCHLRVAQRSPNPRHLIVARNAFEGAAQKTSKIKEPENWAVIQNGLGNVLSEHGEREQEPDLFRQAVNAQRASTSAAIKHIDAKHHAGYWTDLGNSLRRLGEVTKDVGVLREAVEMQETALSFTDRLLDPMDWEMVQSNLALALHWLGAVTQNDAILARAREGYTACETLNLREDAPFDWAKLQWNIADLALARYQLEPTAAFLTEARTHVDRAREVFVEGSDYQTQRCDELLAQIDAAESV